MRPLDPEEHVFVRLGVRVVLVRRQLEEPLREPRDPGVQGRALGLPRRTAPGGALSAKKAM